MRYIYNTYFGYTLETRGSIAGIITIVYDANENMITAVCDRTVETSISKARIKVNNLL